MAGTTGASDGLGLAAALAKATGYEDIEPAYCIQCGTRNAIWDERCRKCGGPKKWVYPEDMTEQEIEAGRRRLRSE